MTLAQILSEEVIQALGWTVIHSLWQAALLAALTGLGMLLMHRRPARERYLLSLAALAGVLVWAAFTFLSYYEPALPATEISGLAIPADAVGLIEVESHSFWNSAVFQQFSDYFAQHTPLIAMAWLMGMTFFALRMLGSLLYAKQLKRRHTQPLSEQWTLRMQDFTNRMGIRRAVRLLESAVVKTPMTIGYLKPVILLPIGMVNNLSPQQVEAVLAHELAHIYRRDYLINIFQAIIETLFYFNPAVWWLSAAVRAEREDCCDDIAVPYCNNSLDYAKALLSVQEWSQSAPSFALAFANGKNRLLNRVRRILNHPQNKSNIMEKFTATCLLLLALVAITVSAAYPEQEEPCMASLGTGAALEDFVVLPDSLPKGRASIIMEKDNKMLEAKVKDGKITYLKIDGKEIAPADYQAYESMVEEAFGEAPPPPPPPFPPTPPMPPAPPGAPAAPSAPRAPMPPPMFFDGASKVTKESDSDGNTIIRIEREEGEAPMVFEWKSNGETFHLNGEPFDAQEFLVAPSAEGHREALRKVERYRVESEKMARDMNQQAKEMQRAERDYARQMAEYERQGIQSLKENRQHAEEHQKAVERQIREEYKHKDKEEMEKALAESRRHLAEHFKAVEEHRGVEEVRVRGYAKAASPDLYVQGYAKGNGSVERALEGALIKDGLIKSPRNYKLEISGKGMKINGKKQSDAVWEKYKDIYRKTSGFELSGKSRIVVEKDEAE